MQILLTKRNLMLAKYQSKQKLKSNDLYCQPIYFSYCLYTKFTLKLQRLVVIANYFYRLCEYAGFIDTVNKTFDLFRNTAHNSTTLAAN